MYSYFQFFISVLIFSYTVYVRFKHTNHVRHMLIFFFFTIKAVVVKINP